MDAAVNGEETVLTVTAPELIAGVTARTAGKEGALEYDGVILETGALSRGGLSPMAAFPALLAAARSGFITACSAEEREGETRLRVACGQPEAGEGQAVETVLWFHPDTHALTEGEILVDGLRVIRCRCKNFLFTA